MFETVDYLDNFKYEHIIVRNQIIGIINGNITDYCCSDFEPSTCSCSGKLKISLSRSDTRYNAYQRIRKLHFLFHMYAFETVIFFHNAELESSRLSSLKMGQTLNQLMFTTAAEPQTIYSDSIEWGLQRINSLLNNVSDRLSCAITQSDINIRVRQYKQPIQ